MASTFQQRFIKRGEGLRLIEDALQRVERHNDGREIAGEPKHVMGLLEACNCKARLSEAIFQDVAQEGTSDRFEDYKMAVREKGKGSPVEALVTAMMHDVCEIANDSTIEAAMKAEIISLSTALEQLSKMEPSVSNEQPGSHFSNYGSGNRFNTTGGTQNNNMGNGNQFPGLLSVELFILAAIFEDPYITFSIFFYGWDFWSLSRELSRIRS